MAYFKFSKTRLSLATTLVLGAVAACGGNEGSESDSDSSKDSRSGGESSSTDDNGKKDDEKSLGGAGSDDEEPKKDDDDDDDDSAMGGDSGDGDGDGDEDSGGDSGDGDVGTGGDEGTGGSSSGGGPPDVGDAGFIRSVSTNDEGQLDLLFVVDNSVSMADKQNLLAEAVPQLVQRLTNPDCVDNQSHEKVPNPGACPDGYTQEARAFNDIHIGLISSSLGGHGSTQCGRDLVDTGDVIRHADDRGRLNPTMREAGVDVEETGFLAWNGEGDIYTRETLIAAFSSQLAAVGENGCGFEAPLESWYRFLVDPQPPEEIVLDGTRSIMKDNLVDEVLLQQREAFLRPESWLAIVVLTDENDCSLMDGGSYYPNASYGWLVSEATEPMLVATEACETNPNDECCFSCLQASAPPDGCETSAEFCADSPELPPEEDRANVRCFDNARRFGVDLLYPTDRYVEALTQKQIIDARDGSMVDNPLLMGAGAHKGIERDQDMVFLAGIVGVPWQDLATPQSLLPDSARMDYLTAVELAEKNIDVNGTMVDRWQLILGDTGRKSASKYCKDIDPADPDCGRVDSPPLDPFMIESIEERTEGATNPITGDAIVASTSNDPQANGINGHEMNKLLTDPRFPDGGETRDDLQYACIFELELPNVDCSPDNAACDCGGEPDANRSVCQPPTGGEATTTQYYSRAYPGTRVLRVLRDFGENSIVGSICPKFPLGDPKDLNYGYNPILQQLVDRVHVWQAGSCFDAVLPVDESGVLECAVVETRLMSNGELDCSAPGRAPITEELQTAARTRLEEDGQCGDSTGIDCDSFNSCVILELAEDSRERCLHDEVDTTDIGAGFCFIDPSLLGVDPGGNEIHTNGGDENGDNIIVANCAADSRRMLRFSGVNTPSPGASTFVICDSSAGAN